MKNFTVDLTKKDCVASFVRDFYPFTTVIHCAAIAHGENPPSNYSVSDFNTLILENLLSSFCYLQPHWIFLSSILVYGVGYEEKPVPIIVLPETKDNYGAGKLLDKQRLLSKCDALDILRLMPTYDSHHMMDVKIRVFFSKTNIKFQIVPSPLYSLFNVRVVCDVVLKCLIGTPGRSLHAGDGSPISQHDLLKQYPGFAITIPQN